MLHIYWQWFVQEGWVVVLACLNLLLVVRLFFWAREVKRITSLVEFKQQGMLEKVRYAIDLADTSKKEVRRLTGKFEAVELPGNEDDTHIREKE